MPQRLHILADENIPGLAAALGASAELTYLPGRHIQRTDLKDKDVLLVRSVTQVNADLLADSEIQFVGTATIGLDHIDLDYLNAQDIAFTYAPGSNAQSVVEYVLAAMAYWTEKNHKDFSQLTVGIVGVGRIGSLLQSYLKQLGINCLLCDPPRMSREGRSSDEFLELSQLSQADVISFHVPLTTTGPWPTKHMINSAFLASLDSQQLLINSARGDIFDNDMALDMYKQQSDLPELVLDVWQQEPNINGELLKHCLLATPHIAGYAYEGKWRATKMLCQALQRHFQLSFDGTELENNSRVSQPIEFSQSINLVNQLRQKYAIEKDDQVLRSAVNALPESFDSLRKNYPIRHEFLPPKNTD